MAQYQENAIVTRVEQLSPENYRITFQSPKIAADSRPGQFVMVRSAEGTDPLLRRPFSLHHAEADGTVQLYFKVVGKGTQLMSQFSPGEEISLLGPLGKGFEMKKDKPACLVGGGLGIAPLLILTAKLVEKYTDPQKICVILGGRTKEEVAPLVGSFTHYGVEVLSVTDDGSFGERGFVTTMLERQNLVEDCMVYTCGPEAMMAKVNEICAKKDLACQVSVEKDMACGMGACLGCCKTKADGEYTHVCINGPVYYAEELQWEE